MQLSSLSLALTAAYGPGFAWRNFFTGNTPGFRVNVEEAIRLNQQALGPELVTAAFTAGDGGTLVSQAAGVVTVENGDATAAYTGPNSAAVVGRMYFVSGRLVEKPTSSNARIIFGGVDSGTTIAVGRIDRIIVATGTGGLILANGSSAVTGEKSVWSDISVREIDLSKCVAFQDSAGTLPVVSMEQPLGLILDTKLGVPVRGVELVLNGAGLTSTTNWSAQGGATLGVASGALTVTGTAGARAEQYNRPVVANRWYELTVDVTLGPGVTTAQINFSKQSDGSNMALLDVTSNGPKRFYALATESNAMFKYRISAGTGTVTFANISVRELPGNHFVQPSNTPSRPIVSRRVNLLDRSGEPMSGWSLISASRTAYGQPVAGKFSDAAVVSSNGATWHRVETPAVALTAGVAYTIKYWYLAGTSGQVRLVARNNTNSTESLLAGAIGSPLAATSAAGTIVEVSTEADGNTLVTTATFTPTASGSFLISIGPNSATAGQTVVAAGADLRMSVDVPGLPPYQRVTSSTDYDEVGFPAYARADGLDDWLESGVVDMSSTDAVTVIAGVKKRSDAAYQVVVDFSTNPDITAGAFGLGASTLTGDAARRTYGFGSSGQFFAVAGAGIYAAPSKSLLTGVGRISTDTRVLRINGVQAASSSADQGTGNYGAHKFFLLRRAGTTNTFNGRLYGVTVIGKLLTDSQLAAAEQAERQMGRLY